MIAPPIPVNEAARLAALREIGILDSLPESEYDAIVTLAAAVAGTPIAAISLVDDRRQWFKACIGLGNIRETARSVSFCGHAIVTRELLVVPDALQDARFADNPLVIGPPFIRYYAGLPLIDTQGHALGTLCVIDSSPRRLSQMQLDWLQQLAVLAQKGHQVGTADLFLALDKEDHRYRQRRAGRQVGTHPLQRRHDGTLVVHGAAAVDAAVVDHGAPRVERP